MLFLFRFYVFVARSYSCLQLLKATIYADDMLTQRHDERIIETFEAACWLNVFAQRNQLVWGHLKIKIFNAFSNGIKG